MILKQDMPKNDIKIIMECKPNSLFYLPIFILKNVHRFDGLKYKT